MSENKTKNILSDRNGELFHGLAQNHFISLVFDLKNKKVESGYLPSNSDSKPSKKRFVI